MWQSAPTLKLKYKKKWQWLIDEHAIRVNSSFANFSEPIPITGQP